MSYILTELAYLYDGYKPWIVPFVQFLGLLLFTFVLNRSYQKLVIFLSERMQVLDLLAKAFYLPLIALIYFSFFWNFVPHLVQYAHWSFSDVAMDGVYKVVMLAIFIWFVGRFAGMVKDYLLLSDFMKEKLNQRMVYFTFELVYWTLILVFILGSLHILDIKISDTLHMLGQGIIIWSFTLIFLYTLHVGFKENIKVFSEKGHFFAATILNALFLPILLMVLSIGLAFTFRETKLGSYLPIKLHLRDLLVPIFFWAVYRATSLLEKEFLSGRLTRRYPDKTRVQTIGKFSRMFTLLIALFLIMLSDRLNYASQIAKWIGGGSFIVAIAARTTLDNYLSGFVIHLEGNFKVGDWIYSTDKQIEGIIEYMGMRTTTLRTLDKRLLFVPNSFFSTSSIVNASKMTNRKIDDVIPIERTNQVTVNDIIYDVRAMLRDHPDIDHAQEAMANFINFGSSALHINVRAFTKTKDLKNFRNVRQDVMLKVMEIVEKHGVALAPSCYLEVTQKSKKSTLL